MDQIELIEKRKPREKHFLQRDGTIRAEIYDTDIHYLKNGKYEEIDNTLIKEKDLLVNKSNDYRVEFKEDFRESLMKMSKDNHYIDFKLMDSRKINLKSAKRMISKEYSNITFNDITDDIKIEYQTLSNKVKETIVLQNSNYSELSFLLDTNLNLEEKNGEIVSKDELGNIVFKIEKPFMVDSNEIRNDKIHYFLCTIDNKYVLTLILDEEWLKDKDRLYPVYIDPTIDSSNTSDLNFFDTFIYPGDDNVDKSNLGYLVAGVNKVNGQDRVNRTLIKFDLPTIGTGYEIVEAYLSLSPYPERDNIDKNDNHLIEVHRLISKWDGNDVKWDEMYNKFDSRVEYISPTSRSKIVDNTIKVYPIQLLITGLVKKWYEDTPNNGIMLKSCNETYTDENYPLFYSKNNTIEGNPQPVFIIKYRNRNGIENYWDYKVQNFTDGKALINTHTGNLTTVFDLGRTIGGPMPATLNLVYNTNDVILGMQTFFGKGFKLNFEQVIERIDKSLQYTDEDGTIHYFYQNEKEGSNVSDNIDKFYYDEDGLNLRIEDLDTTLKLFDSNNTEMVFIKKDEKYYLNQIKDSDNNTVTITYNSNNSISKVTDKYNNEININYNLYDIQIISSDNKVVKLNYTDNKLSSIDSIYGTILFTYTNDIISSIVDVNGLKSEYEYYDKSPYRIKKVKKVGNDGTIGSTLTFTYSIYETSIIDDKGIIETIAYNDYGNVESRSILEGENQINNAYSSEKTYDEKNKLTSDMIIHKYINNYLTNTSFEDSDMLFTSDEDIITSFDNIYFNSGLRSLKVESSLINKSIEQTIKVPKGKSYTFSGYFKNDNSARIILSYTNSENEEIYCEEKFDDSDSFERQDVTLFYGNDAISDLKIRIQLDEIGILYLDDIQLEEGEVANYYNIIENSDFKNGLTSWDCHVMRNGEEISVSDYIGIVDVNNDTKALKVMMGYDRTSSIEKNFNIKGKKGEAYTISFWYKNSATIPYGPNIGSNVSINYEYCGENVGQCILSRRLPITNGSSWQHFVHTEKSIKDFKAIKLIFNNAGSANDFQVTNISLYKDVTREEYNYDSNDNLVSVIDQSNNESGFRYDKENQLTTATNTLGKSLSYEYDINKKNRLLSSLSPSGLVITNTYRNGNLVKNKLSKGYHGNITDGIYKLRRKGTCKYIKAELNMVLLEENDCSNTIWYLEKHDDKFKIIYNINRLLSISYRNGHIVLDDIDDNNLFYLEQKEDKSYVLRYEEVVNDKVNVKYLRVNDNDLLVLKPYDDIIEETSFYIEKLDDLFIENDTNYSEDSRFKINDIDSSFRKVSFENDALTGNLKKIINPKGISCEYKYNNKGQCVNIKSGELEVNYSYDCHNLLTNITQGNKNYGFNYNSFLKVENVTLNNNILSSVEYDMNDGQPKITTYGNNQKTEMKYDTFNRISKLIKEDDVYNYYYDTNGNVSKVVSNNNIIKASYDSNNRLHSYSDDNFKVRYLYDSENLITNKKYKYKNCTNTQINTFDEDKIISTSLDDIIINYGYDDINRNIMKNINNIINSSVKFISNGKRTSNIIDEYQINGDTYKYVYDEVLNPTKVYLNNNLIKEYDYDIYNELIKEINYDFNTESDYLYDNSGNIISKVQKNILTNEILNTINYTYNNSNWEDQLTLYNNNPITYDNLGNMTSFNNSRYSWKNGVELASITNNIEGKNITYKYDASGIRKLKVYNGIVTKYYTLGDEIVYEDRNGNVIYYLYDSYGLVGFKYNNAVYYYLKDLQDDIIGILDQNGNKLATYGYDSWGKILFVIDENGNDISNNKTHIANINPFRYRGYYYDDETGLYYLNHRYYNPEIARFISPDLILGANGDLLSYNLYAYVGNNPISNYDRTGNKSLLNKIISAVVSFMTIRIANSLKNASGKKNNKDRCISGVCLPPKTPSGLASVTSDVSINNKIVKSNEHSTETAYLGEKGKVISIDHNIGGLFGYDIYGPASADFYGSITAGSITFKNTCGTDNSHFYYGMDLEIDITENTSISGYLRFNVNQKLAMAMSLVYAGVTVYVAYPVVSKLICDAGATALGVGKKILEVFNSNHVPNPNPVPNFS